MSAPIRIGVAAVSAVCLAGCATPPSITPSAVVTSSRTKVIATERAKSAVAIGRSTRADVAAALGETLVISFDTGFEVWVYRLAGETRMHGVARTGSDEATRETGSEYVILFSPSGLVAKTRIRPAPQDGSAR